MLEIIKTLMQGKFLVALVIATCLIVLCLSFAGVISWNSPETKAAEQILEKETGIQVIPPADKSK